jgi:DNA invertase Pin-like site-specific DNA recombinase
LELEGIVHKKIFVDKPVTGKMSAFDRPAFSEMLQAIKTNVSTLFVYELSQIGQSFLNTLEIVQRFEEEFHIVVWSLSSKERWTRDN